MVPERAGAMFSARRDCEGFIGRRLKRFEASLYLAVKSLLRWLSAIPGRVARVANFQESMKNLGKSFHEFRFALILQSGDVTSLKLDQRT